MGYYSKMLAVALTAFVLAVACVNYLPEHECESCACGISAPHCYCMHWND